MATIDTIARLNSALAGRYEIEREVGAGGMAIVYLARDARHSRSVAVKVLRPELGAVLGGERFLSEIRVTARLQHPHLLPLFDSGEADGLLYYVMPFVDGESLQARLDRERQLGIEEAVRIAASVADALDHAHRHGVVHRDLKPGNILMQEGQPMVADFGIALAVSRAGGERVTQTGLSLGTPHYMSPEQATGDRAIDARSDIYSLGAVLYEMLVGEPPHTGNSVQAVIAKVVTERPRDVRLARPTIPEHVALALDCALAKVPADRWSSARAFAEALRQYPAAATRSHGAGARGRRGEGWRDPVRLVLAAVALGGVAFGVWGLSRQSPHEFGLVQFSFASAPEDRVAWNGGAMIAIAPDARMTVYSGTAANNTTRLMVRHLSDPVPREIPNSRSATAPFFSPDGRHLFFGANGRLMRSDPDGSNRVEIATMHQVWRGSAAGDLIVLGGVMNKRSVIATVSTAGGALSVISRPDTGMGFAPERWPLLLPDAKTIVYASYPSSGEPTLALISVRGTDRRRLDLPGTFPLGYVDGHLVYVRVDGLVAAVPLDLAAAQVTGPPIIMGDTVGFYGGGIAVAALAASGALVYQSPGLDRQLALVDVSGSSRLLTSERRHFQRPRFSPDGSRVLVEIDGDLWTYDVATAAFTRVTRDSTAADAEWTPDGRRILYRSGEGAARGIWWRSADGSGSPQQVLADGSHRQFDISPDGRTLVHGSDSAVLVRSLVDGTTTTLPGSDGTEIESRYSPDARLLAFSSMASGRLQVYVRPTKSQGPRIQVSVTTGGEPRWSRDGTHLYFRDGDSFWRARIVTSPVLAARAPERQFRDVYDWDAFDTTYDISPDGRQFLMLSLPESELQVTMVLNWIDRLRDRIHRR